MPVPVSSSSTKPTTTATPKRGQVHNKKTRIVRRRGRAKGDFDSDEEIEREIATDSDSGDDLSSLDSASDSDTEPASEDVISNDRSHALTSSTSDGFEGRQKETLVDVGGPSGPFFGTSGNWSEMVAEENAHGPTDLPVIDFADFSGHVATSPTIKRRNKTKRPAPKPESKPPQLQQETDDTPKPPAEEHEPTASAPTQTLDTASPQSKRAPGQTARQAYQKRLEDPSFVPKVGEFWGHDDRLYDKDLRSLSGWWRGRWQGRGRGRGSFDRGFSPRGRGGYSHASRSFPHEPETSGNKEGEEPYLASSHETDVPPIERAWTHDGFEEMKRKDERRQTQRSVVRGGFGTSRGRGFVPGRGRGGVPSSPSTRPRTTPHFTPPPGRPWFAMKPERVWTKQQEGFLYFDHALKPRHHQGPGVRVKLPGSQGLVVRTPLRSSISLPVQPIANEQRSSTVSDYDGKHISVRLPTRRIIEKSPEVSVPPAPANDKDTKPAPVTTSTSTSQPSTTLDSTSTDAPPPDSQPTEPSNVEPIIVDPSWISSADGAYETPASDVGLADQRPSLPPLQTTFTPPVASPTYGSPYAYAHALPPGLALNQHGVPYELATGRPVYFQSPMPPMYDPRPMLHPQFVPGHMHHPSMDSPDLLNNAPPITHTPPINNFIDPSTGTPIFSFPRQTRIKISAPDGTPASSKLTQSASGLRTSATTFEPARITQNSSRQVSNSDADNLAPALDEGVQSPPMDPMMGFSPYPQQYYYPNYVYPQYMEMSQIPPYEFYPPDPRLQGAVYY